MEAALELQTMALFAELGWDTIDCYREFFGGPANATPQRPYVGREHQGEVVLQPRLRTALARLNPDAPPEAVQVAVDELLRDRSAMSLRIPAMSSTHVIEAALA